ncbi:MAG: BPSS1780 family membrane protein [Gammaproteobacteria bacterium]|nr:BPSS1780 family membrane protein [Gammaproteobacteria bacterium]
MSDNCKVVFSGELQPGFEHQQVLEAFSKKFGVSREKAGKLLAADKDVVLKGGLDEARATKYQGVLEKLGLVVRIDIVEPQIDSSTLALEPIETPDDESTVVMNPSELAASLNNCPKCGSSNVEDGACKDCGIILEKFLNFQARQEEEDEDEWQAKPENPYTSPKAELVEPVEGELNEPQGVPTGNAVSWLAKGWSHFKQNPFAWILALVVWFLLAMVVSLIPLLGGIVVNLLTPIITAGFIIGCRAQDDGDDFSVGHLFAGFSTNTGQLVLVGVIYFGVMILVTVVLMGSFFGLVGMQAMDAQDPEMMVSMLASPGLIGAILLGTLLFIPVMMAYLFAPALVALDDLKAIEAMKMSFSGCLKNLLPFTVYGLLAMIMLIVASIPFGLGLLIVLPVLTASIYAAYRDIYYY